MKKGEPEGKDGGDPSSAVMRRHGPVEDQPCLPDIIIYHKI